MGTPRFSVLTPVYETPADVLRQALESVRAQTFADWELCLADDGSKAPHVRALLGEAARDDERVRVALSEENEGIVAASNRALAMAEGEFVALLDHDDLLDPEALALVDEAIRGSPEADYVYTDEDKIDLGGRHSGPFFKPDWSPERMRTQMYTCHLSVMRRALVEQVGGFDPDFEGSQDWDLVLRVTERAAAVIHIPRVLYHWRMLETSAAGRGAAAKDWAFEAGARALQAHCDRTGIAARVERDREDEGIYHLRPTPAEQPPVSIIIPTAGQAREVRGRTVTLVSHCARSIVESSGYGNYELVCVFDRDTDRAVLDELREAGGDRLRLVPYDGLFSFSAKINLGAQRSEGEHLLLLNDDMEVATPDWIERMVMYSSIDEVGAVGGRLVWESGRLQHVGVRFEEGLPGHPYRGSPADTKGYGNEVLVARDCLAVTGACMMTRRELFEEVGGLSATLPFNYNDIDYCLKLISRGRRIVYDPDLVMYHFESSSRSTDVADWEKQALLQKWRQLTDPDPYDNPNLRRRGTRLRSLAVRALGRTPRLRALAARARR